MLQVMYHIINFIARRISNKWLKEIREWNHVRKKKRNLNDVPNYFFGAKWNIFAFKWGPEIFILHQLSTLRFLLRQERTQFMLRLKLYLSFNAFFFFNEVKFNLELWMWIRYLLPGIYDPKKIIITLLFMIVPSFIMFISQ